MKNWINWLRSIQVYTVPIYVELWNGLPKMSTSWLHLEFGRYDFFRIFNVLSTPIAVWTIFVLVVSIAVGTMFVQTFKNCEKVLCWYSGGQKQAHHKGYSHFEGLEQVMNSRYRLGFASKGTMSSWRVLAPLNVVYHCPYPFRWAYTVPE